MTSKIIGANADGDGGNHGLMVKGFMILLLTVVILGIIMWVTLKTSVPYDEYRNEDAIERITCVLI